MRFTNNPTNAFFTLNTIIYFIKLNELKKSKNIQQVKSNQKSLSNKNTTDNNLDLNNVGAIPVARQDRLILLNVVTRYKLIYLSLYKNINYLHKPFKFSLKKIF